MFPDIQMRLSSVSVCAHCLLKRRKFHSMKLLGSTPWSSWVAYGLVCCHSHRSWEWLASPTRTMAHECKPEDLINLLFLASRPTASTHYNIYFVYTRPRDTSCFTLIFHDIYKFSNEFTDVLYVLTCLLNISSEGFTSGPKKPLTNRMADYRQ